MPKILFTRHALQKLALFEQQGRFAITKKLVIKIVLNPEDIDYSRWPLLIAQARIDSKHVLRVVYKYPSDTMTIITFYPGRIKQYFRRYEDEKN